MQEGLHVLGQSDTVIEFLGIQRLDLVQLEEQREREVLQACLVGFRQPGQRTLELVADVVAMHGLVADDETDEVCRVGELAAA